MPTELIGKLSFDDAKDASIFTVMVDKSIRILRERLGIYKGNEHKYIAKQINPKSKNYSAVLTIFKKGRSYVGDFTTFHNEKNKTIEFYIKWKELKNNKKRRKRRVF